MQFSYLIIIASIAILSSLGLLLSPYKAKLAIKPLLLSILSVCAVYIPWDYIVVNRFWHFVPERTLSFYLWTLPLEEILFFIIVPYALLVIYVNFQKLIAGRIPVNILPVTKLIILLATLLLCFFFWGKWYTVVMILILVLTTIFSAAHWKTALTPRALVPTLVLTVCLTYIFNSFITGLPIVVYNEAYITNFRIGTIPIEDFFYGIAMILLCLTVYDKAETRYESK